MSTSKKEDKTVMQRKLSLERLEPDMKDEAWPFKPEEKKTK